MTSMFGGTTPTPKTSKGIFAPEKVKEKPAPPSKPAGPGTDWNYTPPGGAPAAPATPSYQIPQFESNTERNPQLDALSGEWAKYRKELGANTDLDATNALQRQRDLTSGNMREMTGLMSARGARPGTGANAVTMGRVMAGGARNTAGLNASLASDGRRQQLGALSGETGAAMGAAGINQAQQNFGLNAWQANAQAQQAAAQLAALQQQNQFNNQMKNMQFYTGF